MENPPGRLTGVRPVSPILAGLVGLFCGCATVAGTLADLPAKVGFPALAGGRPCQTVVVQLADTPIHVTVVPRGANPQQPSTAGGAKTSVRVIGHDPVSRLGLLEFRGTETGGRRNTWLDSAADCVGNALTAPTPDGPLPCRIIGWEKRVGGKILPLALLKVDFQGDVPPPGTPIMDDRNRIAGIVFQSAGRGRSGYALPAEAIHRVCRDIRNGGVLARPRLGLTLNAQNPEARVLRVLPGSPAAAAGIRPDDILLQVGGRSIRNYADVPDAFFYLIPGQPARIVVQRGSGRFEASITPGRTG